MRHSLAANLYLRFFAIMTMGSVLCSNPNGYCETPKAKSITIGIMSDLTGSNSPNGVACRQGSDVALNTVQIPEKLHISMRFEDHRGEAAAGVSVFKKLADVDNAISIISNRSQIGMAINPLSKQAKIPLLGVVGHPEFISQNPYAFRFYPSTVQEGRVLANTIVHQRLSRLAIISIEDAWTVALANDVAIDLRKMGGNVVFSEAINPDELEFSSLISRIRKSSPDGIFVNLAVGQAGLFIRKLREQGFHQQLYGNFFVSYKDVIEAAGAENIEGLIFISMALDRPIFLEKLHYLYPNATASGGATYACYAATTALLQAINASGSDVSRESVGQNLLSMKELKLLDESPKVVNREVQFELVPVQFKGGKQEKYE